MPKTDHRHPLNSLDAAARRAFRLYCDEAGGASAVAQIFGMNARTIERIYRGKRDVPPGLAREVAREWQENPASAHLLEWAQQRSSGGGQSNG